MKILFLGTSAGWPLPRLGCNCKICTSKDLRDKRLRPSLLINQSTLIDANPDIYHQIKKYNIDPAKIEIVLITHGHDDHFIGLYDLSHIYHKNSKVKTQKSKVELITTKGILSRMRQIVGVSVRAFKIIEVKPFEKIHLGNDSYALLIPVVHSNSEAFGIKVKAPKPIFYAPEFRKILPSSKRHLGDLDLAILDGSSKTSFGQAKGHETIEEGIRLGKEIKAKRILFTNIGHKTDTHKNLVEFVIKTGGNKFSIAYDGLPLTF